MLNAGVLNTKCWHLFANMGNFNFEFHKKKLLAYKTPKLAFKRQKVAFKMAKSRIKDGKKWHLNANIGD